MGAVIRVENLGKLYQLGKIGTGTLSHDLKRWWALTRGREDPFAKIGRINDRTKSAAHNEYVWALRDISFQVNEGDVIGIIGKNGAGKSTLLKIISRITAPSHGCAKIKGRIGSLLEVGTGFHPEMTGRENVYMNGTVLGMSRHEINRKFDDIVDFAGVAKYIDTPVKRYSSGMMVRLGFAVAAFLEPEILIVDEVLAVGDADFQKRAIGKMQEVSKGEGRTVLFVSHSMKSINLLCNKALLLENGSVVSEGYTTQVIDEYLSSKNRISSSWNLETNDDKSDIQFRNAYIAQEGSTVSGKIRSDLPFEIRLVYNVNFPIQNLAILVRISNSMGETLFTTWDLDDLELNYFNKNIGVHNARLVIPENLLKPGEYYISIGAHVPRIKVFELRENLIGFSISEVGYRFNMERDSIIHPNVRWYLG